MDRIKQAICTALAELDLSLADASAMIGCDRDYLRSYVYFDDPGSLPADVRARLALELGIPPVALTAPRRFRYPTDSNGAG